MAPLTEARGREPGSHRLFVSENRSAPQSAISPDHERQLRGEQSSTRLDVSNLYGHAFGAEGDLVLGVTIATLIGKKRLNLTVRHSSACHRHRVTRPVSTQRRGFGTWVLATKPPTSTINPRAIDQKTWFEEIGAASRQRGGRGVAFGWRPEATAAATIAAHSRCLAASPITSDADCAVAAPA